MSTQKPRLSDAVATHHHDVETALAEVQMSGSRYRQIKAATELVAVVGTFGGAGLGHLPWMVAAGVAVLAVGGVEAFDTFLARRGSSQNSDAVTEDTLERRVDERLDERLADDNTTNNSNQ